MPTSIYPFPPAELEALFSKTAPAAPFRRLRYHTFHYLRSTPDEYLDTDVDRFCDTLVTRALSGGRACKFCGSSLLTQGGNVLALYLCPGCFWYLEVESLIGDGAQYREDHVGLLKPFDVTSRTEPLAALAVELIQRWDTVREIHPSKLEELVASILRGILDCDTRWVGKSGDGGIGVVALLGDTPLAIQVKRRGSKQGAEGVSVVREFCGAMIEHDYKRGMIVTTASHFSAAAKSTAGSILDRSELTSLELLDVKGLCDMFRLVVEDEKKWSRSFRLALGSE